jgi:hypothetical protein
MALPRAVSKDASNNPVEAATAAIKNLSRDDLAALAEWFNRYHVNSWASKGRSAQRPITKRKSLHLEGRPVDADRG